MSMMCMYRYTYDRVLISTTVHQAGYTTVVPYQVVLTTTVLRTVVGHKHLQVPTVLRYTWYVRRTFSGTVSGLGVDTGITSIMTYALCTEVSST